MLVQHRPIVWLSSLQAQFAAPSCFSHPPSAHCEHELHNLQPDPPHQVLPSDEPFRFNNFHVNQIPKYLSMNQPPQSQE